MHRVELKAVAEDFAKALGCRFLMHRVELKVRSPCLYENETYTVPNAPCGVESLGLLIFGIVAVFSVPNAPCGVERWEGISGVCGKA